MVPEGYQDMDHQSSMLLGEINGKLETFMGQFEDDRAEARIERRAIMEKLGQQDMMKAELEVLTHTVAGLKSQVYSNKAEIDKLKYGEETKKQMSIYTMKLIGFFGAVFTMLGTAVWGLGTWIEAKWHLISIFFGMRP